MIYLRLFWEFFKTGLFAFGGGMATVPFLSDMSARTGWFTQGMLADMIAVSESTPGAIGVNMATYVGFSTAGIAGGVIASLGLVAPSILVVLVISAFLKAFRENRHVNNALYGIRPASTGLIAAAGVSVLLLSLCGTDSLRALCSGAGNLNWKALPLLAAVWVLSNVVPQTKKLHPIVFILLGAVVGAVFRFAGA